jgi:hypothetical protein
MSFFEKKIPPPLHRLLHEAILEFHHQQPQGVADLQINPNVPPSVFEADIIPRSAKAARITVRAEDGDLEAMVAFGKECQADARYYYGPNAEQAFKAEVMTLCGAISKSHWQEKIVRCGNRILRSIAILPPPIGKVQIVGWRPFSFAFLRKKTDEVINWEPYV